MRPHSGPLAPLPAYLAVLLVAFARPSAAVGQSASVLSLLPLEEEVLRVGSEATGTLSSSDPLSPTDAHLDAWELVGEAGASVTVDVVSDDFDAVLYVVGPGLAETLFDDDGAGGCNARITLTFLESGPHRVVVSSIGSRATGTYGLRVTDRPSPAPEHACGQPDPQALAALPTEGRELALGSEGSGRFDVLTASVGGRPVQAWSLAVTVGQPVSIVQESADFDSYLYVLGPGVEGVLADDDGAGDLNSRVELSPTSDGPYTVVASALDEGASGSYGLRVVEPVDLATLPAVGSLEIGQTLDGLLDPADGVVTEGRRGQVWSLQGAAGDRVTVDLVSDAFDAFLYVAGPGLGEVLTDDDGGGDLNARISFVFPQSGEYRVIAAALGGDATGPFTLRVTPG